MQTDRVIIRPRTAEDLTRLSEIAAKVHNRDGYPIHVGSEGFERFLTVPASLAAWVGLDNNGAVVGHVAVNEATSPPVMELATALDIEPRPLYVARLLVAPEARRLGVGRALLDAAAAHVWSLGRTPMLDVVEVPGAGPALALYQGCGWVEVGRVSFDLVGAPLSELVFRAPAATVTTERLDLEPLRVEHAKVMVEVLADEALYRFTGGEPPSLESLTSRYRQQVAGSGEANEVWRNWILRQRPGGQAVGFVQATVMEAATELAWLVGTEAQGHGLAKEATEAMKLQLHREGVTSFEAWIHPAHDASKAVARSLQLSPSGEFDEDGEERWTNGGRRS